MTKNSLLNKDVNRNQEDTSQGEENTWAEIESIIVSQREENAVNEINEEQCEEALSNGEDEEFQEFEANPEMRRKAGRPRINRTGNRGRPAKIYYAGTAFQECANIAEISLNEALNGNEAEDSKRAIQSEFESLMRNNTWV